MIQIVLADLVEWVTEAELAALLELGVNLTILEVEP